jgi:two-component system phosphate regulon response regulator PhoB
MLVDDHPLMTLALGRYLEKVGFEVEQVNDSPRALRVAHTFQPHAMILDYQMPGLSGADVAWQFESDPVLQTVPIMICSGYAETISRAELPPRDIPIVLKPFDVGEIAAWIRTRVAAAA